MLELGSVAISDLPPPPEGCVGWPWTEEAPTLPPYRSDGNSWPPISIVTPSFNQGRFIEETIRSVLLQGYPNLEYFVIDGGSTDNSVEVIEKYAPWLTYWHSQKDKGQADAINFALKRATGHWFQNINSDDVLLPNALLTVGQVNNGSEMVCGDVIEFSNDHEYVVRNTTLSVRSMLTNLYRSDTVSWHQPGVFLRTDILKFLGGYRIELGYVFDFHMTCLYLEQMHKQSFVNRPLVRFRIHEEAKSSAWTNVYINEAILAREMLSDELSNPSLKQVAKVQAARRRLIEIIRQATSPMNPFLDVSSVFSLIKQNPSLLFDRMLLGSLRQYPKIWVQSFSKMR